MRETLEELYRYLKLVECNKRVVPIAAFVICVVGWVVVALLPNQYQVKATLQVERSSMLQPLLKDIAVKTDIASEMAGLMRQTMLVPKNLEAIAVDAGLVDTNNDADDLDWAVFDLEKAIKIDAVEDKKGIYTVTYKYSDPQVAQRVVDVLITRFIDSILKAIREDSEETKRILDEQIAEHRSQLEESALKVKRFKEQHMNVLSEDGRSYYSRLQEAKSQYQEALLTLHEAEQEVEAIRDQPRSAEYTGSTDAADRKIQELEETIEALQLKFTEEHPYVIARKKALEKLKEKKRQQLANRRPSGAAPDTDGKEALSIDPGYQTWKTLLTRAEAKAAALRSRVFEYKRRLDELQEGMSILPQLETELANIKREFIIQEDSYHKLVARRESATISEKIEKASDLKINMIEPPRVPLRPVGPKRVLLNTVVLFGGIGAGVGIALVLSLLNPLVFTRHDLDKITDLPILGTVSLDRQLSPPESNRPYFVALGCLVALFAVLNLLYLLRVDFLASLAGSLT
jgi:polysaccharide chain length determinant protein (PEP-CTERM system associated)